MSYLIIPVPAFEYNWKQITLLIAIKIGVVLKRQIFVLSLFGSVILYKLSCFLRTCTHQIWCWFLQ